MVERKRYIRHLFTASVETVGFIFAPSGWPKSPRASRPVSGWGCADVIKSDLLAEADARGIAAMLAAGAELDRRTRRPTPLDR